MSFSFDFFNYNFSGLISIFAALVGMAYPLIHQAIQRVDEMYDSTLLAGYVQRQLPIKKFNAILLIAIVCALTMPFLLRLFAYNETVCICFSVFHSIVTLLLILSVILLYHFLQLTVRPSDMLKHIIKHPDGGRPSGSLIYAAQIARFASRRNDQELYIEASSHIAHVIMLLRREYLTLENFPLEAKKTLLLLSQYFSEKPFGLISHSTLLSSIYFDLGGYYPFSDEEFGHIWKTVDLVIQSGNENFVSSYWTFADQYYRFVLKGYSADHPKDKEVQQFHNRYLEQHTMLGALLLFNKRYGLLKSIMYFSNTFPPQYPLVPSSFTDIHASIVSLCKLTQYSIEIAHRYSMIGMTQDANSDNEILSAAYQYHAILLVRLFTINDYFVYSQSKAIPEVPFDKIEDIEKDIRITNRLISEVNKMYSPDSLKECLTEVPDKDEVLSLLEGYLSNCKTKIEEIKNIHKIDYTKIEYIRKNLLDAAKRTLCLPQKADVGTVGEKIITLSPDIQWSFPISSEIVETGTYTNASNLPELIIGQLNEQLWNAYSSIFMRTQSVADFDIDFKDIKHALDRLGIDSEYAVISLGVYLGTFDQIYSKEGEPFEWEGGKMFYNKARVFSIPSSAQSMIVLLNNHVPYCSVGHSSEEQLHAIDDEIGLYSNIDTITIENAQIQLRTKLCLNLNYVENLHFIRLNIKYKSDRGLEIDNINRDVWNNNPFEQINKLKNMKIEDLMSSILECFPGHSDHSIKVGNIIMPQHVAAINKLSPMQAKELLEQLCDAGYLTYEEATERKVTGYHLTEKGFEFYNNMM